MGARGGSDISADDVPNVIVGNLCCSLMCLTSNDSFNFLSVHSSPAGQQ